METPILDMTLSTPLPSALTRLRMAFSGVSPVMTPRRTRSSTLSMARYGLTAAAPYPMSSATWCTSRTSPASTSKPDLGAGAPADEVVVHGRAQQQRRDRRVLGVGVAVGQHDEPLAAGDVPVDLGADLAEPLAQPGAAVGDAEQAR